MSGPFLWGPLFLQMEKILIYDFPTRIFHWLFSTLFIAAFIITKTVDNESPLFSYHMLIGLTLGFLVVLRLVWGITGTRHARFSDFALSPKELLLYFRGIFANDKRKWAGHNPASSWSAILMLVLALGSAITGFLMTSGAAKENFEDLHELCANTFFVVTVIHILGVLFHTIRHKDLLGLSMVHGRKIGVPESEKIPSSKIGIGLLLVGLVLSFSIHLFKNYDSQSGILNFFGVPLTLAENSEKESESE